MNEKKQGFENLPEEQRKEIEARIAKSSIKHQALKAKENAAKAKRKAFKSKCHEGNEYLKQFNKEDILSDAMKIKGDFVVSYLLIPTEEEASRPSLTVCKMAYSIKAPSDSFKKHIATGLCGYRIKNDNEYTATIEIPKVLLTHLPSMVKDAIENTIKTRIILMAPEIPQKMINAIHMPAIKAAQKELNPDYLLEKAKEALRNSDFDAAMRYSEAMLKIGGASQEEIEANRSIIELTKQAMLRVSSNPKK